MLMEAIMHLMNLNIAWFISLAMGNLFLVFGLFCLAYFFADCNFKRGLTLFIYITLVFGFVLIDMQGISGFTYTAASYLLVLYIGRLIATILGETTPSLRKHTVMMVTTTGVIWYFIYNWFMV